MENLRGLPLISHETVEHVVYMDFEYYTAPLRCFNVQLPLKLY